MHFRLCSVYLENANHSLQRENIHMELISELLKHQFVSSSASVDVEFNSSGEKGPVAMIACLYNQLLYLIKRGSINKI